jgi:hypothetical protein
VLSAWLASWASLYSNSAVLRTVLGFAHVGGLVVSGGPALVMDRAILRAVRAGSLTRGAHLAELEASHPLVLSGLALAIASGLLLMTADLDTFLYSRVFWIKMTLVALLLMNGWNLRRLGRDVGHPTGRPLARAAIVSVGLWMLTTLAGAALPNV